MTEEMIVDSVKPYSADIWKWAVEKGKCNLISVTEKDLLLTLLPRTAGKFTRHGLKANRMRYHCEGYTDRYLEGGGVTVAYNPDDVTRVWLLEDGRYAEFTLIDSRYKEKPLSEVQSMQAENKKIIRNEAEEALQAKIDLARHIEAIAGDKKPPVNINANLKGNRQTRKRERSKEHENYNSILRGEK